MKLRDWDSIGRTYQERIKGLENENMILKDKNEILQVFVSKYFKKYLYELSDLISPLSQYVYM